MCYNQCNMHLKLMHYLGAVMSGRTPCILRNGILAEFVLSSNSGRYRESPLNKGPTDHLLVEETVRTSLLTLTSRLGSATVKLFMV